MDWKVKLQNLAAQIGGKISGSLKGANGKGLSLADLSRRFERFSTALKDGSLTLYGNLLTVAASTYFVADLTAMWVDKLIPEPPKAISKATQQAGPTTRDLSEYDVISSRNLFNSQGKIPGEGEGEEDTRPDSGPPVRTSLPLNLIGTLILRDELKSLATLEDKTANMVYPVRVADEVPSLLRVTKIEPTRVIFVNLKSGRNEFVDLPEDLKAPAPISRSSGVSPSAGVSKRSSNQFNISRTKVDQTLGNLGAVLTQARAIPNIENGKQQGYKLFQIVPGSIYDELGLKDNDVIMGLNGEVVNDPGKAFEMLNELKTQPHLELQIKRGTQTMNMVYDIN